MVGKLVLEVEPGGSPVVKVGMRDPDTGKMAALVASGGSVEELEKEISSLKGELDRIFVEAKQKLGELSNGEGSGARMAPEKIWKNMEACATEDEMIEYFNSLGESQREETAEYIFTNVNMFKGRGPIFSERYDTETHTVE